MTHPWTPQTHTHFRHIQIYHTDKPVWNTFIQTSLQPQFMHAFLHSVTHVEMHSRPQAYGKANTWPHQTYSDKMHTHTQTHSPLNPFNAISSAACWHKRPMGLTKAHLNSGKWNRLWKNHLRMLNRGAYAQLGPAIGQRKLLILWWCKMFVICSSLWCNQSSW